MFFDHLPQRGLIGGHRGARSIAPENSFLSMELARKCGAHFWETDIRISGDNELIVFHDNMLKRTTDIAGHKEFQNCSDYHVEQFTYRELQQLDMGSWFLETDPFSTVADGKISVSKREIIKKQKIQRLDDILTYSKSHTFPVNLEIKSLNTEPGDVAIVDMILDKIQETETMDIILLSSFRHEYLQRAKFLCPDISIAVLVEEKHPDNILEYLQSFSAVAYHPDEKLYDAELYATLLASGVYVNSWTVNNSDQAREMLALGTGIITDWPQKFF